MKHCEVHILNELRLNVHWLHEIIHSVSSDHLVCHSHSERLHRVTLVELIVPNVVIVEVADYRLV